MVISLLAHQLDKAVTASSLYSILITHLELAMCDQI